MKVSVMITTYNCGNYIDNAIESVITQDMPFEWELLISDDGSSDNTLLHIEEWKKKFPDVIKVFSMERKNNLEKNGTRAAKNRANLLKNATGEYLIFLDGDDQFLGKDMIARQVALLDSSELNDCACTACNILANDILNELKYPLVDDGLKEGIIDSYKYWENYYFHTNTILFRSECKKMLLQEEYRDYLNDNFITYIILQYGKIYYIPQLSAQYNLTGDGLWTGKKRVYGCFRNLILYDLEVKINKNFRHSSMVRHLYDFRYIFKNYKIENKEDVKELVDALDSHIFHNTLMLYESKDHNDLSKVIKVFSLRCRVELINLSRYIYRIKVKIKQLIRQLQ